MEKKKWFKSKRAWGLIIAVLGKVIPAVLPEAAPYIGHLTEIGEILFGVGCLDAKQPIKF